MLSLYRNNELLIPFKMGDDLCSSLWILVDGDLYRDFHDLLVGSNVLFIQQSLHKAFSSSLNNSLSDIVNSLRQL
jgi:hypothetical protein